MFDVKQTQKKLQVAALYRRLLAGLDNCLPYPKVFYRSKDLRDGSKRTAAIVNQPGSV